jgi:uracil-DNA glycosylase family 4
LTPPEPVPAEILRVRRQIIACRACPRLREYCARIAHDKKAAHREETYWGRPVPGFGDPRARLLVLGLAPAAHGANRTGRVFTGDGSGDFLMRAMFETGFATRPTSRRADDGLQLVDAWIAAAVRCAPPDNKPRPEEIRACRTHLDAEWDALTGLRAVVALGRIAFDAALARFERTGLLLRPKPAFAHGAVHALHRAPLLIASYHPSRQNTNTGKLTPAMLAAVFTLAREHVSKTARQTV